jgi:purine-nucleoside phosphorylase
VTASRIAVFPGPGDSVPEEVASAVSARTDLRPSVAIVLGSGLGRAIDSLREVASFSYDELPGLPSPTAPGHSGRLLLGELAGVPVTAFLGRFHYYEGHPMRITTLPARVARALGARAMIVTAAVGAIDTGLGAGSVVIGADHLNLMGENPLRAWRNLDGSPPFVEMSEPYDPRLAELAATAAERLGVAAARGVYAALSGPTYETPAETEFLRRAGASVVGMSVVPEVVPARALGMRVLGLFAVTNAVGVAVEHEEIVRVSDATAASIGGILAEVLPRLEKEGASFGL